MDEIKVPPDCVSNTVHNVPQKARAVRLGEIPKPSAAVALGFEETDDKTTSIPLLRKYRHTQREKDEKMKEDFMYFMRFNVMKDPECLQED